MENLQNLPYNIFDIGIIITLLISGVLAYSRGFVHEVLSIIGWVGAIFATIYGFPSVQPIARQYIPIAMLADFIAGTLIFLIALTTLWYCTQSISKRIRSSAIGVLDKSVGFIFGLARGAIIICILYIGFELLTPKNKHPIWLTESRLIPIVLYGAMQIKILIPDNSLLRSFEIQERTPFGDSKKLIEEMLQPKPKAPKFNKDAGYGKKQRKEIERLIGNNSDN